MTSVLTKAPSMIGPEAARITMGEAPAGEPLTDLSAMAPQAPEQPRSDIVSPYGPRRRFDAATDTSAAVRIPAATGPERPAEVSWSDWHGMSPAQRHEAVTTTHEIPSLVDMPQDDYERLLKELFPAGYADRRNSQAVADAKPAIEQTTEFGQEVGREVDFRAALREGDPQTVLEMIQDARERAERTGYTGELRDFEDRARAQGIALPTTEVKPNEAQPAPQVPLQFEKIPQEPGAVQDAPGEPKITESAVQAPAVVAAPWESLTELVPPTPVPKAYADTLPKWPPEGAKANSLDEPTQFLPTVPVPAGHTEDSGLEGFDAVLAEALPEDPIAAAHERILSMGDGSERPRTLREQLRRVGIAVGALAFAGVIAAASYPAASQLFSRGK